MTAQIIALTVARRQSKYNPGLRGWFHYGMTREQQQWRVQQLLDSGLDSALVKRLCKRVTTVDDR
jgi:hypothetical protein